MSARPGLYGGQPAMVVPTVINIQAENHWCGLYECHRALVETA
jgi:hypothetical protein